MWLDGEKPYAQVLQHRFRNDNISVEIMNFSVDGILRDLAILRQIETEVLDYEPDLILASISVPIYPIVWHREIYKGYVYDAGHSGLSMKQAVMYRTRARQEIDEAKSSWITPFYDISYVVRGFFRWYMFNRNDNLARLVDIYHNKRVKQRFGIMPWTIEASVDRILRTKLEVKKNSSELLIFQYGYHPEQENAFSKHGLQYFFLKIPEDPSLRHKHDGHLNQKGQILVASQLLKELRARLPPSVMRPL